MLKVAKLFSFCLFLLILTGCGNKVIAPAVSVPTVTSKGSAIVRTAQSQTGVRYRFGGTTPKGFDCSGLIWWAYRQHGYEVPRRTSDQANAGRTVKKPYAPGDILVFNIKQRSINLHTALYVGNGYFIHSPSKGRTVRQDHLEDDYWKSKLIRVRRILN